MNVCVLYGRGREMKQTPPATRNIKKKTTEKQNQKEMENKKKITPNKFILYYRKMHAKDGLPHPIIVIGLHIQQIYKRAQYSVLLLFSHSQFVHRLWLPHDFLATWN